MRHLIILFGALFSVVAHAATETINWFVDGGVYATTTCETGGDIALPTTPTKYGYTFHGWDAYIPLEYIESTGDQQIITDISGFDVGDWEIYVKWMVPEYVQAQANYAGIVGVYESELKNTYRIIANRTAIDSYRVYGNSIAGEGGEVVEVSVGQIHEATISNGFVTLDGEKHITTAGDQPLDSDSTFKIAMIYTTGSNLYFSARYYAISVKKSGVLAGNFVPAKLSDNKVGLFDTVSHQFYESTTDMPFIAGPVVGE